MARNTIADIKVIIETSLTDPDITVFINTADIMVTTVLGTSLTTAILKEIEKYLTAHLIASTRERQTTEEQIGDAKVKYSGKYGETLLSTSYGQMVLQLDTSGKFSRRKTAKFKAAPSFKNTVRT